VTSTAALALAFLVAIVGIALNAWSQDRNEERRVLARWVGGTLAIVGVVVVFGLAVVRAWTVTP
jgi:uncharacterized membrane protein